MSNVTQYSKALTGSQSFAANGGVREFLAAMPIVIFAKAVREVLQHRSANRSK